MNLEYFYKHRSWVIAGGLAILIGLWLLSGQFGDSQDAVADATPTAAAETRRTSVRVRTQSAEPITRTIVVNGNTAPARVVNIAAETEGRVEFVGADRGSNVDRGRVIARLDERDRAARLAQADATLKQRELEYAARERLKGDSYVSEAQLQEAVAMLETAKAELTRAELDLGYMQIRAPFNGALQERHVEQGDFVSRGDPVATFVDNRTIIVSADVSEFDARHVEVGEQAEARLATGETVHGRIRYVAPVADAATRTFNVELEVDNSDGQLRAGGTAELRIPAEEVLAHRLSPSLLTLDDAGNIGVKIVDDDGAVEFIVADIALSSSDGIWIAGLPATATIITVGHGFVADGAVVNAVAESDVDTAVAIQAANE